MPKGGVGAVVAPALAVVAMIAMAYLMVGFYNHFVKTILVQAISRDLRFLLETVNCETSCSVSFLAFNP